MLNSVNFTNPPNINKLEGGYQVDKSNSRNEADR